MSEAAYDASFYADLQEGARRSARHVLPLVFERIKPASVVDFGCGSGGWLAEAEALGADGFGLDGPWVPQDALEIAAERFQVADLTQPVKLGRSFDLALCLEVAEHLPAEAGAILIQTLTRHAPAVLFSAAIPGQGGTDHVNEAWPEVWHGHFAEAGFDCHDIIRSAIWTDARIEPWYRQNLLLFIRRDPGRAAEDQPAPQRLVHPEIWSARIQELQALSAQQRAAEAEVARLGNAWQKLADENAHLEAEIATGKAALVKILHSRSWRLTEPLRKLDAVLRRPGK